MRVSRSKSVDHFRQILEDVDETTQCNSVKELRTVLLGVPEAQYLLDDNEVNSIMNEIEMELAQTEEEKQANMIAMETEDVVERHSTSCIMCSQRSTDGALCSSCRCNILRD